MRSFLFLVLFTSGYFFVVNGQTKTRIYVNVPQQLKECYNNSYLLVKDNLLPMTMTTFIALLQKLETLQPNQNARILSSALLNRFRFDGVEWSPNVEPGPLIIPYLTTGHEFQVYKIIFENLISNQGRIENDTFSLIERCTLHWMLSSSIDKWERSDGDKCDNLSKNLVWNSRRPRSASFEPDVEVFDVKSKPQPLEQSGNFLHIQGTDYDHPESECPIENGVVYQMYGAVNLGIVLAGIAAGTQPQTVNVEAMSSQLRSALPPRPTLRTRARRPPVRSGQPVSSFSEGVIDNTWAATYSGILSEVALIQGTTQHGDMDIGVDGVWNDTIIPKYYFMKEKKKDGLTVPRIRGAIDGKIMADNIQKWNGMGTGDLKLSQIFDMYYSDNGVFDKDLKACNRKLYSSDSAKKDDLQAQTTSFSMVLREMFPLPIMEDEAIDELSSTATSKLLTFIPQMYQLQCPQNSNAPFSYAVSDITVVLDASWEYEKIRRILELLVENVVWNYGGTNLTIMSSQDGKVFINSTKTILDYYANFNSTIYKDATPGFDMLKSLTVLRRMYKNKMDWDRQQGSPGGISQIVLFIPTATSTNSNTDRMNISDTVTTFKNLNPDVKFLFLAPGSSDRFKQFVDDPNKDIVNLDLQESLVIQSMSRMIKRISEIPRRIFNSKCYLEQSESSDSYYNTMVVKGYLARNEIQYYRIAQNYFYNSHGGKITVQTLGSVVNVCQSRYNANPGNSTGTSKNENCTQVSPGGQFDIWVSSDLCSDKSYAVDCNPLYISISSAQTTPTTNRCTDAECRTPDMIKYTVSHQGLGCYSGVTGLLSSPYLMTLIILFLYMTNKLSC